jgi:N-acyl-D-aspartate/D-glutamate deacylase
MRRLSMAISRPVSFILEQNNTVPEQWRDLLKRAEDANAAGADLRPQVAGRPLNMLVGFQTFHPFTWRPTYARLADLPLRERIAELRKPEIRAAILSEESTNANPVAKYVVASLDRIFPMGEPPNYEPSPDTSVSAIAKREGRPEEEVLYDLMLRHDGRELLMFALLGYSYGNLDDLREMLVHPMSALGLSDGGAHCGVICDASMPTFMLAHWARDRDRGEKLPLEVTVQKVTRDPARLYGLGDRGVVAPGFKGDLNLIDFDRLNLKLPELVFDLPGGARRLIQHADGYVATIVSGEVTMRNGADTGARPGRVLRGAR